MEDAAALWPVTVQTGSLEEPIALFEEEMV